MHIRHLHPKMNSSARFNHEESLFVIQNPGTTARLKNFSNDTIRDMHVRRLEQVMDLDRTPPIISLWHHLQKKMDTLNHPLPTRSSPPKMERDIRFQLPRHSHTCTWRDTLPYIFLLFSYKREPTPLSSSIYSSTKEWREYCHLPYPTSNTCSANQDPSSFPSWKISDHPHA